MLRALVIRAEGKVFTPGGYAVKRFETTETPEQARSLFVRKHLDPHKVENALADDRVVHGLCLTGRAREGARRADAGYMPPERRVGASRALVWMTPVRAARSASGARRPRAGGRVRQTGTYPTPASSTLER